MFKEETVAVLHAGRAYTATYRLQHGQVLVSSAYGSKVAPVGRKTPERAARGVLEAIVADYHAGVRS